VELISSVAGLASSVGVDDDDDDDNREAPALVFVVVTWLLHWRS
jgi:hypothetical protein